MIAILRENYGHTYVTGIYKDKKTAGHALLKPLVIEGVPQDEFRWIDFTFGETYFDWDENGRKVSLVAGKVIFSQQRGE